MMRLRHAPAACMLIAAWSLAIASEQPRYEAGRIHEASGGPHPSAETVNSAAQQDAARRAFPRLARYVFGTDRSASSSGTIDPAVMARTGIEATADGDYENKPIPPQARVWYCGYETISITIRCVLGETGSGAAEPAQAVDPKLPALVDDILNAPQTIAGVVMIPLFSIPMEFTLAGELAESIMCGSSSSCGIIFAKNRDELAALLDRRGAEIPAAATGSNRIAAAAIGPAATLQR